MVPPRRRAGDAHAQYHLGFKYATGVGVSQDYVAAYMWLDLAGEQSSGDDRKAFVKGREAVAARMTSEQSPTLNGSPANGTRRWNRKAGRPAPAPTREDSRLLRQRDKRPPCGHDPLQGCQLLCQILDLPVLFLEFVTPGPNSNRKVGLAPVSHANAPTIPHMALPRLRARGCTSRPSRGTLRVSRADPVAGLWQTVTRLNRRNFSPAYRKSRSPPQLLSPHQWSSP